MSFQKKKVFYESIEFIYPPKFVKVYYWIIFFWWRGN